MSAIIASWGPVRLTARSSPPHTCTQQRRPSAAPAAANHRAHRSLSAASGRPSSARRSLGRPQLSARHTRRGIVASSTAEADGAQETTSSIRRIPITVITGFLGSGKTTTLNNLLKKEHGRRIAIIENEFGEIDIDGKLVTVQEGAEEQIMMLNNGCLCCTVRGDLVEMIFKLYEEKRDSFDHLVIETTGLANPAPIIQTFTDPDMAQLVHLDSVVTVVDAKHITRHLDAGDKDDSPNEALEQLAYADRIVLNKTDLVTPEEVATLESRISGINSMAQVRRAQHGDVEVDYLIGVGGFDLDQVPLTLERESHSHGSHTEAHSHSHDDHDHSECDHDHGNCVHDSHDSHSHSEAHSHSHDDHDHSHDDHDHSECDHDHGNCVHEGHDHSHDHGHSHGLHNDAVSSVSMTINGDVDLLKVNTWLDSLLDFRGDDLYRMKGILSIAGFDRRFVFQGVHQMFEGNPDRQWKEGEDRKSQIVFIGRDLDREVLQDGFYACKAEAAQ